MSQAHDQLDPRRKRLLWRATHRGIREMDLILGGYVARRIAALAEAELAELEVIIEIPDQLLLNWATRQETVPATHASPLLLDLLNHRP
jgi:antitoxin CptB